MAQVWSFAILSKSFGSPMWRMCEDRDVDIVAMGQAYRQMVAALEEASVKPEVLLEGLELRVQVL